MKVSAHYNSEIDAGRIMPDPAQHAAVPLLDALQLAISTPPKSGWFSKPKPARGLYLWGGVGRGKSMLMDMFVQMAGSATRRVHFHAFMQDVHAQLHAARQAGTADAIDPVAKGIAAGIRCLALDEMQITDITDAMLVGRLFQALFDRGVTVITTSNRPPDDLYKDGLNRQLFLPFIALIKDRLCVHELRAARDYRQDRLAAAQTYFHPLNAANEHAIQQIWDDLAGGAGATLAIASKSREITLPQFRNGIARADFADICGQNWGPGDYLAIAGAVQVLILENIPQLTRGRSNEAKRFVTLIDALYEGGKAIVISAETPPTEIYSNGPGAFEFERTASRLEEMQSAEWWDKTA